MMFLNQSILRLYQKHESILEKVWVGLLIEQSITIFQNTVP